MTKAPKQTPQKPNKKDDESDRQTYLPIAIVFFAVGLTMLLNETSRGVGIPFLVLGITFFAISQQESPSKRKK